MVGRNVKACSLVAASIAPVETPCVVTWEPQGSRPFCDSDLTFWLARCELRREKEKRSFQTDGEKTMK